jgi:hypothetical protein
MIRALVAKPSPLNKSKETAMPNPKDDIPPAYMCARCKGDKQVPMDLPPGIRHTGFKTRPLIPCPDCSPKASTPTITSKAPYVRAKEILERSDGEQLSNLLHHLWTKAVDTPGYVKGDWQTLEIILTRMQAYIRENPDCGELDEQRRMITLTTLGHLPIRRFPGLNATDVQAWIDDKMKLVGVVFRDNADNTYGFSLYHQPTDMDFYIACDVGIHFAEQAVAKHDLILSMIHHGVILERAAAEGTKIGW